MNKAVLCHEGEWLLFLGADDATADQNVLSGCLLKTTCQVMTWFAASVASMTDVVMCQDSIGESMSSIQFTIRRPSAQVTVR